MVPHSFFLSMASIYHSLFALVPKYFAFSMFSMLDILFNPRLLMLYEPISTVSHPCSFYLMCVDHYRLKQPSETLRIWISGSLSISEPKHQFGPGYTLSGLDKYK